MPRSSPEAAPIVPLPLPDKVPDPAMKMTLPAFPRLVENPPLDADAEEATNPKIEKPKAVPPPPPIRKKVEASLPKELKTVGGFGGMEVMLTPNDDHVFADAEHHVFGVLNDSVMEAARLNVGADYHHVLNDSLIQDDEAIRAELIEHQLNRFGKFKRGDALKETVEVTKAMNHIMEMDPELGRKALALLSAMDFARDAAAQEGGPIAACIGTIHQNGARRWAILAKIGEGQEAYKRRADGETVRITEMDPWMEALSQMTSRPVPALYVRELNHDPNPEKKIDDQLLLTMDDPENVVITAQVE